MITKEQLSYFSKLKKINEYVILREYMQLWFLSEIYKWKPSENIFFKGGTALHLIFGMDRFSEDLDFSVNTVDDDNFEKNIEKFLTGLSELENVKFKKRRSVKGKRFTLILNRSLVDTEVFIDIDFSFREKIIKNENSIINTEYPVVFSSFVNHLSKEEILAEKIRALFMREKGRDLYDIWFLLSQGTKLNKEIIHKKLEYYDIKNYNSEDIIKRINIFNKKKFIIDLRPFTSLNNRDRLDNLFDYIINYLKTNLVKIF